MARAFISITSPTRLPRLILAVMSPSSAAYKARGLPKNGITIAATTLSKSIAAQSPRCEKVSHSQSDYIIFSHLG